MAVIRTIVTTITGNPAPVLFLDTCVLLDIVRAPGRVKQNEVRVAQALRTAVGKTPRKIHLLVGSPTQTEWNDHIVETEAQCEEAINSCNAVASAVSATCGHMGLPALAPVHVGVPGLPATLRQLSDDLLKAAEVIDHTAAALRRAVNRVISGTMPAKAGGKGAKDAIILEHAIEVTAKLRKAHFTQPCIFISSNTGDFAASKASTNLHPILVPVLTPIQLEYQISLENAEQTLTAMGWSP